MTDDAVHPDLWAKVAEFDRCCHVQFTRVGDASETKKWRVTIERTGEMVVAEEPSLARALTSAVMAAQTRGWP